MFVLGDAGDNGDQPDQGMEKTRDLIQREDITLFPIHFNHPLKDDDRKRLGRLSQLGAICDSNLWHTPISKMYNSMDAALAAQKKYESSLERKSMCRFIEQMAGLTGEKPSQIKSLSNENLGKVLEKAGSDYLEGAGEMIRTLQDVRQGKIDLEAAKTRMKAHGAIALGIFNKRIQQLKKQMPELSRILNKRPELAYSELYMAEEDRQHNKILKPVLLISKAELGSIVGNIDNLFRVGQSCTPDIYKNLITQSLTAMIGELLHLSPDMVNDEDVKVWSNQAVGAGTGKSYLGAASLIKSYCQDVNKWRKFRSRLKKAMNDLAPLLRAKEHPRRFMDLSGTSYYWLYPEELFPRL